MAYPTTSSFGKTTLAVEFDPVGASGTFSTICGLKGWTYSLSTNFDETEVPDCDDPDIPMEVQRSVRSLGASSSCTGVWALESHEAMLDWAESGATKNVKITFGVVSDSGVATDTETMTGPAYLGNVEYNVSKESGKVTATFDLTFDGIPTRTAKGS